MTQIVGVLRVIEKSVPKSLKNIFGMLQALLTLFGMYYNGCVQTYIRKGVDCYKNWIL